MHCQVPHQHFNKGALKIQSVKYTHCSTLWNNDFSAFIFFPQLSSFSVFALTCWQQRKSNIFACYYRQLSLVLQRVFKTHIKQNTERGSRSLPQPGHFKSKIQMWTVTTSYTEVLQWCKNKLLGKIALRPIPSLP